MTYRERREARAARRREWAEKRRAKSETSLKAAHDLASQIPLGQPILVGHHSEKRAQRDAERIDSGMRRGFEHAKMAEHHDQAARAIERQLKGSIYSDDADAIEQLEARVAELEAQRQRMKAINAALKAALKADPNARFSETLAPFNMADREIADLKQAMGFAGSCGYPAYAFQNLSGNINRNKKRLATLRLTGPKC